MVAAPSRPWCPQPAERRAGGQEELERPGGIQQHPAARLPWGGAALSEAAAGRQGLAFPMGLPPPAGSFTFCSADGRGAPRSGAGLRGLSEAKRTRAAGRAPGEEASPLRRGRGSAGVPGRAEKTGGGQRLGPGPGRTRGRARAASAVGIPAGGPERLWRGRAVPAGVT